MNIIAFFIILITVSSAFSKEIVFKTYKPLKINKLNGVKIKYEIIKKSDLETIYVKDEKGSRKIYPVVYAKTKTPLSRAGTVYNYMNNAKKLYLNKKKILDKVVTDIISPRKEQKVKLPRNNIAFISTGANIEDSMTYNSMLIRKYQKIFPTATTLYGEADEKKADTVELKNNNLFLKPADFKVHGQFSTPNFSQIVDTHKLLFIFGHGSKSGMPLWKQTGQNKEYFTPKDKDFSKTVMINTNCYGGIFAKQVKCGFFSAHPSYPSSGCWVDPKDKIVNYAEEFYNSYRMHKDKSLEELHWEASLYGSPYDLTYSSLDAFAEDYTQNINKEVKWQKVIEWSKRYATKTEQEYLLSLSKENITLYLDEEIFYPMSVKGFPDDKIKELNKKAKRDRIKLCMGKECDYYRDYYRKLLAAKRLYVKKNKPKNPRYKEITECSSKTIKEFQGS